MKRFLFLLALMPMLVLAQRKGVKISTDTSVDMYHLSARPTGIFFQDSAVVVVKHDTIYSLLLVVDTTRPVIVPYFSNREYWVADTVLQPVVRIRYLQAYFIFGYEVVDFSFYNRIQLTRPVQYLDENKMKLSKNIVVWETRLLAK